MVRQVALVPAGCQPWNHDVVSSQGERFAYSATLAVYVYEIDRKSNEYHLVSIMSEHKKTITSISWCPEKPDFLASSSSDGMVVVWDVVRQMTVAILHRKDPVMNLAWTYGKSLCLGFMSKTGPLWLWHIPESKNLSLVKDTNNFSSPITMFRWHHEKRSQLVFGHEDGSVSSLEIDFKKCTGSKIQKHIFKPDVLSENRDAVDPVIALEWDPLSADYLLLCNKVQGVRLVDIPKQLPIMFFQLPSAASQVQTIAWVKNAPGMFVSGDFRGGILRVWSVSNPTPIENIKIKGTGFHRLEVINHFNNNTDTNSTHRGSSYMADPDVDCNHQHISSTSEAKSPAMTTLSRFTLPHAQIVCAFKDGGIGLYDLGRKKWTFLREEGHIETIFDCKFKPDNPDHLATASFDGTIKIWDITTMTCLQSSPGNEGVIYHLSWAPADLNCIAACSARHGAFIWDVKKGKIIKRLNNHAPKASVFSIAWNHGDPKLIMSCGGDHYCIVQQVDGQVIQKYKHPAPVFGCDWSPFNKDMLATGCEDKSLRVYYLASSSDQPIRVFSGHEGKVFHVRWNPLKEGILCSGSDDSNIRVWDYTRDQCICILSGHSGPVRGLTWNSEVATLLASGSWDYTIRLWDTRDGACLHCILDHGADVYGLTSHPSRPFLLASSSRDSTVRLWSTTVLVQPIELNILAGKPWSETLGSGEPAVGALSSHVLSGRVSKDIYRELSQKEDNSVELLETFSKFFTHPCGTNNLWDLVSVIRGKDILMLSSTYKTGIVHRKHLTQFKGSEAQQLEMSKVSKFGGGMGTPSREERLKEAAKIHIRLGNIQRYCELMVELGKWEKALALAPSVSLNYWQQLNKRYCTALLAKDSDEIVPFSIAGGDVNTLVTFFMSRGQLTDASVVTQSACEGSIKRSEVKCNSELLQKEGFNKEECDRLTVQVMDNLSDFYFRNGSPTLAACCHLAVDNQRRAISKLICGNELELALSIGQVLGGVPKETDIVLELLSRRCEALGKWELGLDLLNLQQSPSLHQGRLCARCSSSMAELDSLHHKAGLPTMESCELRAKSLESSPSSVMDCVQFYLLSSSPEKGLEIGLKYVREKMRDLTWTSDDVYPMLQLLACTKTEKLQHSKNSHVMFELLALCAYVGAFVALKRCYKPVVLPLFSHASHILGKEGIKVSISESQVIEEQNIVAAALEKRLSKEMKASYKSLLGHCGNDSDWVLEPGPDCVASSHLPSHSDVHISVLSSQRIKGQAFFLEDGRSALSLNEALMWAKVNPFSPLGSGVRINPF